MAGYIRSRGKDTWEVSVFLGSVNGRKRRRQVTVRGSKKEAERVKARLVHERETGIDIEPGRITVGDFLERWLRSYASTKRPSTYRRYEGLIRVHLMPVIGALKLSKLRPAHIQEAYARVQQARAPRTALHVHRVLKEALSHAVQWQLLARNPADAVTAPRAERYEVDPPDREEIERILAAADATLYGSLVYVAVMTGMRAGELLGLTWKSVDLEGAALNVRQTVQRISGVGMVYGKPKTARSRRTVSLTPATVARLRSHRQSQLESRLTLGPAYQDADLVFPTVIGTPLDANNFRRAWLRIRKRAGVERVRFHDLRHAHATLLIGEGAHMKTISERLGHAGIAITMDTYGHLLPGAQAEAVAGLDRLFGT